MAAKNNSLLLIGGAILAYFLFKPKSTGPGASGGLVDNSGLHLVQDANGQFVWNPQPGGGYPGGAPGGGGMVAMDNPNTGGGASPAGPVSLSDDKTLTDNGNILQTDLSPGGDFEQGNLSGVY